MPSLLIATSNPGKMRELRALLPATVEAVSLDDVGLAPILETGNSLRENAEMKALAAARQSGMLALADDSGLEVDALDGRPGVRSARFAGEPPDDQRNRHALLSALAGVESPRRTARFVSVVTIASPTGIISTARGELVGTILDHERGSRGFGYDSLFLLPDGRTVAELLDEEKNSVSHRSRALAAILPDLQHALASQSTPPARD